MNKAISTTLLVPVFIIVASLALFTIVRADERGQGDANKGRDNGVGIQVSQQVKVEDGDRLEVDDDSSVRVEASSSASSTEDRTSGEERGRGDEHRSIVSDIVHKLQEIAGKERGIGDDVRVIATEQASTSEDAAEHMRNIESESPLKTFLFGFDFKNLGNLRSSFVTTQNHIDRLKNAADKVTDVQVKAELDAQITALEDTASSTQLFIDQHEKAFSLFGWFLKIIGR